jgi:hypothetical protein
VKLGSLLAVALSLSALHGFGVPAGRAQDNYEIQVYGYDTVDPGKTMVELHSNFTIDLFPAIDLNVSPKWEINFGLGVGLTRSTDHLIAKMILGYRFDF